MCMGERGGVAGLSQFTLVLQKIARGQLQHGHNFPPVSTKSIVMLTKANRHRLLEHGTINREVKVTVYIDDKGYATPGDGVDRRCRAKADVWTTSATGSDLKSSITAATKGP